MKFHFAAALPFLLSVAAFTSSANGAVTITSWAYQTLTTSSSLTPLPGATTIAAFDAGNGGTSASLGGVTFSTAPVYAQTNTVGGITMGYSVPNVSWATNFSGTHSSPVLSDIGYTGSANGVLEFSGLTNGQTYTFQFIAADNRGGTLNGRQFEIVGATVSGTTITPTGEQSAKYTYAYDTGEYAVISATFTADATGKAAFLPRAYESNGTTSAGTQVNAVHIMAVPEPSVALLGGLGVLGLLRRRR